MSDERTAAVDPKMVHAKPKVEDFVWPRPALNERARNAADRRARRSGPARSSATTSQSTTSRSPSPMVRPCPFTTRRGSRSCNSMPRSCATNWTSCSTRPPSTRAGEEAAAGVRPAVSSDHPRGSVGPSRRRSRSPLRRPWLSRQGDVRRHRQGHGRPHVREGEGAVAGADWPQRRRGSRQPLRRPVRPLQSASRGCARWTWRSWSASPRTRLRTSRRRGSTSSPIVSGCRRRTWRASSRTRTIPSGSSSSAPCGSPASTCRRAARSTSTSR